MVTVNSIITKNVSAHSILYKSGSSWVNTGATSSTNTYDIWITKTSTF